MAAKKKTKAKKKKPDDVVLTEMQKAFCKYFLGTGGNATQSARLAGYAAKNEKSLAEAGRKNLRNPLVIAHLSELAIAVGAASPEELQTFWTRVMRGQPMPQQVRGELVIAPFDAKAQVTASQLLAKSRGMFIEKIEVENKGGVYVLLPDNERDEVAKLPRRVDSEDDLKAMESEDNDDDDNSEAE